MNNVGFFLFVFQVVEDLNRKQEAHVSYYQDLVFMKNIHIGSIIKQKVEDSSLTVKEFANRINCERTTVYHIFRQKSIDIEKLMKISEALNYDFITEVYLKRNGKPTQPAKTIFIAVAIDTNSLQQLTLPDDFIHLIKE